jgi:hypothetical protein
MITPSEDENKVLRTVNEQYQEIYDETQRPIRLTLDQTELLLKFCGDKGW